MSVGLTVLLGLGVAISQGTVAAASDPAGLIRFLQQTVTWYRQLPAEQQIASEPNDAEVLNDNRRLADEVVRLAFEFARAETEATAKPAGSNQVESQNPASSQYQSLFELSAKLDKDVQELQGELQSLKQKLETANGRNRQELQSQLAETQGELELTNARRDAVRSMAEFVGGTSTNGLGATGLRAQVEALARAVPAALTRPATGKDNGATANEQFMLPAVGGARRAEPAGIWGLAADLFALSRKIHALDDRIQLTDALAQTSKDLRAPLLNTLTELSQRGDDLAKQADTANPATLAQEKRQLDALTAQFKQSSARVLPLNKQGIVLGLYKKNLTDWQSAVRSHYTSDLRGLLVRLGLLVVFLAGVLGLGELWRRTIFRYVHDTRRRSQFLLMRKIVLWFVVVMVFAFAFASQISSVATFAGLLTAGVAVALQNVILSVAGYFFLIGRYGIRVGDRVQISGVTGEVVDIGLVRLHVMELGSGGGIPSGRVVAFPNSIVFQANAGLFRQIPGTNFVWHEITLTLSPSNDWSAVQQRVQETVDAVFSDHREEMERQQQQMERTFTSSVGALQPRTHVHFTPSGLEVVVRFPVDYQDAAELDDRLMRELLKAIDREPRLTRAGAEIPSVTLKTDVAPADSSHQ